jgi:hypothetical protein
MIFLDRRDGGLIILCYAYAHALSTAVLYTVLQQNTYSVFESLILKLPCENYPAEHCGWVRNELCHSLQFILYTCRSVDTAYMMY